MRSCLLVIAVVLVVFGRPSIARADLIDAEIFSSRIREVQEINNTQQLRRTMNRSFDTAGWMSGDDADGAADVGTRVAREKASWAATLVVPASASHHVVNVLVDHAKLPSMRERQSLRNYLQSRFAAFPHEARQASFDPRNVADARVLALQMAYRAARREEADMPGTLMLSVALSRQMTAVFNRRHFSIREKQDARDYYVLVRAIVAPAVMTIPSAGPIDARQRASLALAARTFFLHDTGADPRTVSWDRLPCIGVADAVCQNQTAIARSIFPR